MSNEVVRRFYNENVQAEWARMERHPVEFAINSHYIKRYVQPGMRVLDIGGGPGRYSLMLAELGCEVMLVDLSEGNAAFAREEAARRGLRLEACQGDALDAHRIAGEGWDAVLLMGPLYHLLEQRERERALAQARATLKDGGMLFAAGIAMGAGILYYLQNDPTLILEPGEQVYIEHLERGESYSGPAFTDAHFMREGELSALVSGAGFEVVHLVGSEGICSPREADIVRDPAVFERWLKLSLSVCERPEYHGMAEHLLCVGRKPAQA